MAGSPLPWTGDFKDGLGNRISMLAYANPPKIENEKQRADGYGIVRFQRSTQKITFECWPRFADSQDGDKAQFPGWPITVSSADNDGRQPVAWLPELHFEEGESPVVHIISEATGEILYAVRVQGAKFQPPVFEAGMYTIKVGRDRPDGVTITGIQAGELAEVGSRVIST